MGLEKFIDDASEVKITKKSYKDKVDNEIKNTFEKDIIVCPGLNLLEKERKKNVRENLQTQTKQHNGQDRDSCRSDNIHDHGIYHCS